MIEKLKQKKVVIPLMALMLIGFVVAGAVYYHSISVTATVGEALSSADVAIDFSGYPGETIVKTFNVNNAANVPLDTRVSWTETENLNGVTYSNDMTKVVTLAPGVNTIGVQFVYNEDSTIGNVLGTITLERIA